MANTNRGNGKLPFKSILSELAKQRGLSVKQIAELADVPKSVAHGWLQGAIPYDLQAVFRLSRSLGVSFTALLLGEEDSNNGTGAITELFDEREFFDGYCKVKMTRLIPRMRRK